MKKITKEQAQQWANALRSGEYKQTKDLLQTSEGYCCLGVACRLFIPEGQLDLKYNDQLYGDLPLNQRYAPQWLCDVNSDFMKKTGMSLSTLNDSGADGLGSFSFDEIADLIELVYVHGALDEG